MIEAWRSLSYEYKPSFFDKSMFTPKIKSHFTSSSHDNGFQFSNIYPVNSGWPTRTLAYSTEHCIVSEYRAVKIPWSRRIRNMIEWYKLLYDPDLAVKAKRLPLVDEGWPFSNIYWLLRHVCHIRPWDVENKFSCSAIHLANSRCVTFAVWASWKQQSVIWPRIGQPHPNNSASQRQDPGFCSTIQNSAFT